MKLYILVSVLALAAVFAQPGVGLSEIAEVHGDRLVTVFSPEPHSSLPPDIAIELPGDPREFAGAVLQQVDPRIVTLSDQHLFP